MKALIPWFLLVALFWHPASQAETVIVSDELPINVRSGPGPRPGIIAAVKSGTRLTVLGREPGYVKIRTPKGKEGWVLSRFVQDEPVARELLAAAQAERDQALERQQTLEQELTALQQEHDNLQAEHTALSSSAESLDQELQRVSTAAADSLAILDQNDSLKLQLQQAEQQRAELQLELDTLDVRRAQLILGAGILLAGLLLGLVIPYLRPRRDGWSGF